MKALVRKPGETIIETDRIPGIEWGSGYPLTCKDWVGGSYVLVNDYVPEDPASNFATIPTPTSAQDPVVEEVPDTIIIDGVKYARTT